ncbi:unnamed protein product [Orchesella dallaii]|uniref:ABCA1-4-like C-terminal R2 regulatory domain-containing protein n=1 Tax=Orchesella dallaii TaxID=48710 RepID=A0ABP1REG3_9HEXA
MRNAIAEKFAPCMLKDNHQNVLQYRLLSTALEWDELFKTMEDFKMTYEDMIEDYSLNETSLEEVFLSFARKQKEYRMPGKKKKKKKRKLLIMPMIPFFEKW